MAFSLAFVVAYVVSHTFSQVAYGLEYLPVDSPHVANHAFIFGLFGISAITVMYGEGHYTRRLPWWHQVRYVVLLAFTCMLVQGFLHYVLKYPLSRMLVGASWLLLVPFLLGGRLAVRSILRRLGKWSIPTLVMGGHSNVLETLYALHSDTFADYNVKKVVVLTGRIKAEQLPPRYRKAEIQSGRESAQAALRQAKRAYIVLAPDENTTGLVNQLAEALHGQGGKIVFGMVPPLTGVSLYNSAPQYFFGHNVVLFHPNQLGQGVPQKVLKRALDMVGAFMGLVLLAPLFLVVAVLIKKQSPGSKVFFGHKRVGQGGKTFYCYKFTSMVPNAQQVLEKLLKENPEARAEWERDFKLKNDPRITRIGGVLRKTSLDELPQLWNVLRGDMSLVGPRPIVQEETKYYGNRLGAYLSVRPGVTGLWQVSGRNDTSYGYRVYLDAWYANHWSVWHDVVILFETVKIVLTRSGAY